MKMINKQVLSVIDLQENQHTLKPFFVGRYEEQHQCVSHIMLVKQCEFKSRRFTGGFMLNYC